MRASLGTFQLTPTPPKNPRFDCAVRPIVARVLFSVFDVSGATDRSMPTGRVPVIVVMLSEPTWPLSSPVTRRKLRDGNATPPPQRNAPPGDSNPSALPRASYPA